MIGILGCTGIGAAVGGVLGASLVIHKSYAKEVKVSTSKVLKGFAVGAVAGAAITAATYGGIYLGANYVMPTISKLSVKLAASLSKTTGITSLVKSSTTKEILLRKMPSLIKLNKVIFIGTLIKPISKGATSTYQFVDQILDDFVTETKERENEDINFFQADVRKNTKQDVLNKSYQEMPGELEILSMETFLDVNGNQRNIIFAAYNKN